jgi:hypothetical protein
MLLDLILLTTFISALAIYALGPSRFEMPENEFRQWGASLDVLRTFITAVALVVVLIGVFVGVAKGLPPPLLPYSPLIALMQGYYWMTLGLHIAYVAMLISSFIVAAVYGQTIPGWATGTPTCARPVWVILFLVCSSATVLAGWWGAF